MQYEYIGCGKLGYCPVATEEYIKSDLDSEGYGSVCLKFFTPSYCSHLGDMERTIKWKGQTYNTHVCLYNKSNQSWIDPLYNKKFDDYKDYFQFLLPKIDWVEEQDKVLGFAIQDLSSTNYNEKSNMVASRWDLHMPSMEFSYKNKKWFSGEEALNVLNAEWEKLSKE